MKYLEIKEVNAEELNDGFTMTLGVLAGASAGGAVIVGFIIFT